MKKWGKIAFPMPIDHVYHGKKVALYVFFLLVLISTIRSLIHFLSADGGAGTIAGFDLTAGADNIIFVFALWGSSQLILAFIQISVAIFYRSLIPAMYLLLLIETLFRMFIGATRVSAIAGTPPGGYANYIMLPLCVVMFVLSTLPEKKFTSKTEQTQ
jgi:hypothetical protein